MYSPVMHGAVGMLKQVKVEESETSKTITTVASNNMRVTLRPIPPLRNIPSLSPTLRQIKASFVCENMLKRPDTHTHTHPAVSHASQIFFRGLHLRALQSSLHLQAWEQCTTCCILPACALC